MRKINKNKMKVIQLIKHKKLNWKEEKKLWKIIEQLRENLLNQKIHNNKYKLLRRKYKHH